MNWAVIPTTFRERWKKGYARAGKARPSEPQKYIIQYLKQGTINRIESGEVEVEGNNPDGSVIAYLPLLESKTPATQWHLRSHNSEHYGKKTLAALLPGRSFPFPKSVYAVEDVIRLFVLNKKDAVVLDFFCGSGTTAHAVMRLNKQDAGIRQSIIVTNNEISPLEEEELRGESLRPGDQDWDKLGIAEFITKPRIEAAVTGHTPDGDPVKGEYKFTDEFPMAEGFEENVEFLTLTYESPISVRHNRAFGRIAPLLWIRAGIQGRRIDEIPEAGWDVADTYGLLVDLDKAAPFCSAVNAHGGIRIAYLVTDDERRFQSVARQLQSGVEPVRLYESYMDNFRFAQR
jgi:adenine-specific DNA-methyltransferase